VVVPSVPTPPTSTYNVLPGITASVSETCSPSPPVPPLVGVDPLPPAAPMAITSIDVTPDGTVKVCSAPV